VVAHELPLLKETKEKLMSVKKVFSQLLGHCAIEDNNFFTAS
jgi:hypothetical protein